MTDHDKKNTKKKSSITTSLEQESEKQNPTEANNNGSSEAKANGEILKNSNKSKTKAESKNPSAVGEEKLKTNVESNISFGEICRQKLSRELMEEAEKRSKLLKSKLISQLSEVFKLFDINNDGVIDETDLKFTFSSLGDTNISEEKIKSMIGESSKPIDFNAFVGLFESKEMEFDNEIDLISAFSKWDNKSNGFMLEERFKFDLQTWGDRFSERDADRALEEAPVYDQDGKTMIDYIEFCANLCGLQNIRNSELFQEKLNNEK